MLPEDLSLNFTIVPTLILLAGLVKHSHILFPWSFNNNTSITAPVSSLDPINLAGITFVSFKTGGHLMTGNSVKINEEFDSFIREK